MACDLSGYLVACLRTLAGNPDTEVHVIHYAGDSNAPFRFETGREPVTFHLKDHYPGEKLSALVREIAPHAVICSGWADKEYLRACRQVRHSARVILLFDNPWQGTFRQRLAALGGPLYLRRYFDGCWVAGQPQRRYARKLGFAEHEICEGCYSCDHAFFEKMYKQQDEGRLRDTPKVFLYVGRYIGIKGVTDLYRAFADFSKTDNQDWELWCVGMGDDGPPPELDKVRDFGFRQPSELNEFIRKAGVFVMPSYDDHWGVAVHEFATAGFPLVCSDGVMASSAFLEDRYNGCLYPAGDIGGLTEAFRCISGLPAESLAAMGSRSTRLAAQMTPVIWSEIVNGYLSNGPLPVFRFDRQKARKAD